MPTTSTELLTPTETARRLGVAPDTIRRWVREGRLPAFRCGPKFTRLAWEQVLARIRLRPLVEALPPNDQEALP